MKNKLLLTALAALGFSACHEGGSIIDEPVYYGPGPNWEQQNIQFTTKAVDEDQKPINGIRVVASYLNKNDSVITDTALE